MAGKDTDIVMDIGHSTNGDGDPGVGAEGIDASCRCAADGVYAANGGTPNGSRRPSDSQGERGRKEGELHVDGWGLVCVVGPVRVLHGISRKWGVARRR